MLYIVKKNQITEKLIQFLTYFNVSFHVSFPFWCPFR